MKSKSCLFIGLAVIVMSVSAIQPVHAACGGNPLIVTRSSAADASFIWTQDQFQPHYYAGYMYDTSPPVSGDFQAIFWALGAGNPVIGEGHDSGAFDVTAAAFYYPSYNPYGTTYYFAGELFTGWGVHYLIDGCIYSSGASTAFDGDECTVLLLEDRYAERGYFAMASSNVDDAVGTSSFTQPGNAPIILVPLPDPAVEQASGPFPNLVYLDIEMPVGLDGLYQQEGCDSEIRYKVYAQLLDAGSPLPADRDRSQWVELTTIATNIGEPMTLGISCLDGQDFVIATSLVFDSGFETSYVSRNSQRFFCGCPTDTGGGGFSSECITCTDLDGDGYGAPGDPTCLAGEAEDCDDAAPLVFPGAPEYYDATDNDCDNAIDEGLDDDGDGIPNFYDLCSSTPGGSGVGPDGCSICRQLRLPRRHGLR
jgi:hypothetical protein